MKTTKEDRHERAELRAGELRQMWQERLASEPLPYPRLLSEERQEQALTLLEHICGILLDQQAQMEEFLEFAEDQLQAQVRMETQLKAREQP